MTDFLSSVLPTQGMYCTVGIRNGLVKQNFHATIDDVDAVGTGLAGSGVDAYFALATFNDGSSRKAENAAFLRAFFLDLDCGTGKPYVDQAAAAQALRVFVLTTQLPEPTVVNSGGGLHVYWPLTEDLPAGMWLGHAKSLKRLCTQHNLHADPAVTADCVRILRIPGTSNFKQGQARPIQIVHSGIPSTLEVFIARLPPAPVDLSAAKAFGPDNVLFDMVGGEYPKTKFRVIAVKSIKDEGCAQIKHAIVNAATLEEPLWRAALSIAYRCEDGAKAIHDLSKKHPGYTAGGTDAKAIDTKGPYTCEWYRDNHGALCAGCAYKGTSPIGLGKYVQEAEVVEGMYLIEKPEDSGSPSVMLKVPEYPFPYFRGAKGGVFLKRRDADGNEEDIEIYRQDLYITERFFDADEHGNGDGEMIGINLHLPHDGVRRFFTTTQDVFTTDKLRSLLVKNGVVAYGKTIDAIMAYFASSIRKLQNQVAANKTRNQMGWTPDNQGFVVGELEYTAMGTKLAPPASGTRQLASFFKPTGTLEAWKSMANFYDRPGLEAHALTLFLGFGSPLLKFIGGTAVKGALVHLKSNGSGSGKSTAQMMVNSIFGHPDKLLNKQDDTYAAKIHMLGMMNNIANTIDEITNETPENLSALAYGVTNGRGKNRMNALTNTLRLNFTTWMGVTISSANASVVDKLMQLKATSNGELSRTFEMLVPRYTGATKAEIDAVFSQLEHNYGVAGPIFIDYVVKNPEKVLDLCLKMQSKIDADLNLTAADRFYSCLGAIAMAAGLITQKLGLHEIDIPRIYAFMLTQITENRINIQQSSNDADIVAQETLAAYVNENVRNALVANSVSKSGAPELPSLTPNGPLRLRYYPDTQEMAIPSGEFRKFFSAKQVDVKDALARLHAANFMKHDGKSHPLRIGAGALGGMAGILTRCYVFDAKALGIDATQFTPTGP
jgi:uncharacterized protein (DUF927 family)